MAFRFTALGAMPDDQVLAALVDAFEAARGDVDRARHLLGISRKQLYRWIWRLSDGRSDGPAWRELDRVRAEASRSFEERRARTRGTEVSSPAWTSTR